MATNTGLLLHFKSHTDKRPFVQDNVTSPYALSSETEAFDTGCDKLRSIFSRPSYPRSHIESVIPTFSLRDPSGPSTNVAERDNSIIRVSLLSKIISYKISPTVQPLFVSRKLEQDSRPKEVKPSDVNQQCVVYHFSCDLCDADYVGYTTRHLSYAGGHVREHKHSVIGKHTCGMYTI